MKAIAPGKLILSGEHAVVHGQPAIAMAVDRYATASVKQHARSLVSFDLLNIKYHKDHSISALRALKNQLLENYEAFQKGEKGIKDVLKLPMELTQFAVTNFLDKLNHKLTSGMQIKTHSEIPIGCGLGSSAATILASIHAMANHLNIELSEESYLNHGLEAENLQHGRSSGIDLRVSYHGGCLQYHNGTVDKLQPPKFPIYLVNTGSPKSNTGECVSHVKQVISEELLTEFAKVTTAFKQGLLENDIANVQQAIKNNHQLLVKIGVVPEAIQSFISMLEQQGCAAKLCGAGAVHGDKGGALMIVSEQDPTAFCETKSYHCELIHCDTDGLRIAS